MKKFCIFCGEDPDEKTKEHVIPQWLIKLTGDPKREGFFGFDLVPDIPKIRTYSFNSFSFPACSVCNNKYSNLEAAAQRVIISVLNKEKLNDLDINSLIDWLDKVRIGLWLGLLYLSKNAPEISHRFHIDKRLGTADRLLFLYELSAEREGINFIGTESPSFLQVPSSFAILINNFCFFNVSHFNLCDRRLGFPYARTAHYKDIDSLIEADYVVGLERVLFPVMRERYLQSCSKFFQPIFINIKNTEGANHFINNRYVLENSFDWDKGIGSVFHEKSSKAVPFPRRKTLDWIPPAPKDLQSFLPKINRQVYDFQISVITKSASFNRLSKKDKMIIKKELSFYKRVNKLVVEFVEKQSKEIRL
ncbi:MAG: hypothetical protein JRE10_08890 [Deltaproteobacteria bacterium]|nr:hypothetical protein [Deltaproteobacteria bacterium]